MKGRSMKEWLRDIFVDQNLNDLEHIDQTVMNGVRRWFRSQTLIPTLTTGHYSPGTGKYVLGGPSPAASDANYVLTSTTVNADAANLGLTVAVDRVYRVRYVTLKSDRAPTYTLLYTPAVGTACELASWVSAAVANTTFAVFGGLGGVGVGAGAAAPSTSALGELWMQEGDVLTITLDNFVGGDATTLAFVYEEYVV